MPADKVSVGVIGCGRIAGHHCKAISLSNHLQLAAVCDLNPAAAIRYAKEYQVKPYTNYYEMLKEHPEIKIVAIITPSGMHFSHTMDILEKFQRHVIVEKPTFLRLDHVQKAYALADKLKLSIFPIFQNRYNLAVQRVKSALLAGELGKIQVVSVRVRWCRPQSYYDMSLWRGTMAQDGGALTNQGVHHLDILRFLCGEVESVHATMRTFGVKIDAEDTVVGTLTFKNGAVGTLEVTTSARPDNFEASISIVGSKGLAQIGGIAVNELQIFTPDPSCCVTNSEDFSGCVYGKGHFVQYENIAQFFQRNESPLINKSEVLGTLSLLHSFYRSHEEGATLPVQDGVQSHRLGEENAALAANYQTQLLN